MALTKITRGVIKANENYDTHNINSTGIITAVSANFTGNVSIGGTLTYQDVTNIDSVGIITAQAGINISGGNLQVGGTNVINSGRVLYNLEQIKLADTKELVLGSGNDFKIQHSGSHSFISQEGVGALKIKGNDIRFENASATETFRITSAGESKFTVGTNKYAKFYAATHNDEANLGAGLAFSRPSDGADMLSGMFAHSDTGLGIAARDHVTILTGGTSNVSDTEERLRIDSSGRVMIGTQTPGPTAGKHLTIADSANAGITIRSGTNAAGTILFEDDTADRGEIQYSHNGDYMRFKTTGTERLRINSGGFFNFNNANNNNLQGRVTIFDGGNFSTSSTLGSGDSDNIYLISDASSGYNVYGSSIAWSRVQYADRRVAAIANVQTSTDEDHVGLAFFTHSSADATANIEEKFRITHDGIHVTNGVSNFYAAFRIANNGYYYWDIAVPNEGGYGNSFRCECGYNHYYTTSYGAHRSAWISTRGTSSNNMFDQDQSHSQAGAWSFSKPNNTTFRIEKSAGSYGGQGYGFIHVRYNYF